MTREKPGERKTASSLRQGGDFNWKLRHKGRSVEDIRRGFLSNLEYNIARDPFSLTLYDEFLSLSYTVRERLIERWIASRQQYHTNNVKRVYYLSMEFLLGRLLADNIINLQIENACRRAISGLGLDIEEIIDQEHDAGLGNGGLGRLAACFLDSMATLKLPAVGYGIRYDFGIFNQRIVNGNQIEMPETWLQFRNPWEIEHPEYMQTIKYYGKSIYVRDSRGKTRYRWVDTNDIIAMPYDIPIPGYEVNNVNTLRLWSARATEEFNFQDFNQGDYIGACETKLNSENISKVLYPNDNNVSGRELRLKQQHFFTSASLQDIIRRYLSVNDGFGAFAGKVAIQLNDTHPSIAIVELMRLLIDEHNLEWEEAWTIVTATFAYTNHTLMPEALERWPVPLMRKLLPRHLEIIFEINARFMREVSYRFPGDTERLRRMSIIEEGEEQQVRMAYLAIVGSHSVNGVSKLHTKLLCEKLMKDFFAMWPHKFNSKTNGISPRRWLYKANPSLRELISGTIGESWVTGLSELKKLARHAGDRSFQKKWETAKRAAKESFAEKIKTWEQMDIDTTMMFDVQVKRIHEYKRQLLNVLHCIALYSRIKEGDTRDFVPRAVIFGGKAAPGYFMAKLIIKFINNVAGIINHDPATKGLLAVHFLPNYRVSLAESIIPAADLSEQISTAGTEASGTGNMKFALNGALTIGTMDGANIEMLEQIGAENMFIFGLKAEEIEDHRNRGYNPWDFYNRSPLLKRVIDLINSGFFSPEEPHLFRPLTDSLLSGGDRFMVMADFDAYVECQNKVAHIYKNDPGRWTRMSILNVAQVGIFSSDRAIDEYAREIWKALPVEVKHENFLWEKKKQPVGPARRA
ncbi:MAG: glycogen/starch/alpha-glucan phosphorylase [Chitinispirillaceae bacterium]|nr:glycogen/starch/alpha-glucan phosphorylase [Chitinispirillaceae bacterium]